MANVVIIGAGPAGVSAALYTARAGVDTTVLTKGPGALARAEGIENYYGVPGPVSGAELERRGIEGLSYKREKQDAGTLACNRRPDAERRGYETACHGAAHQNRR